MAGNKVVKDKIEDVYSLTPLQEGMLFHKLYDQNSSAYVIQSVYRLKKEVDIESVRCALGLLSKTYAILRTSIFYEKWRSRGK